MLGGRGLSDTRLIRIGIKLLIAALAFSTMVDFPVYYLLLLFGPMVAPHPIVSSLWFSGAYLVLDAAIAVLGLLALTFVYRGRWELGPRHASMMKRAALATIGGAAALVSRMTMGILVGYYLYLPDFSMVVPVSIRALNFIAAIFLGLFLLWTAIGLAYPRRLLLVYPALILGIMGSLLYLLSSPLLSLIYSLIIRGVVPIEAFIALRIFGDIFGVGSLGLWLIVYLRVLRGFPGRIPAAPGGVAAT